MARRALIIISILVSFLIISGCALKEDGGEDAESAPINNSTTASTGVKGTVSDASTGAPLPGATVTAGGISVQTGSDGKYLIDGLDGGSYGLTATLSGYYSYSATVYLSKGSVITFDINLTYKPANVVSETYTNQIGDYSVAVPANGTNFTVSGNVQYFDRVFDHTGFTGTDTTRNVRYAKVQVLLNTDGTFYVRCLAEGYGGLIKVTDLGKNVYAYKGADTATGGNKIIDLSIGKEFAEPFNIFDTLIDGYLYVEAIDGKAAVDPIAARWESGGTNGTFYSPATDELYLIGLKIGVAPDNDAWDDIVILHEFSHFVASKYSLDQSPGGDHYLTKSNDKKLTWSEGFATFFALKIFESRPYADETTWYVDTTGEDILGTETIYITYEIETPDFDPDLLNNPYYDPSDKNAFIGDANEVSVSAFLWDITDDTLLEDAVYAPMDVFYTVPSAFWDVFTTYIPVQNDVSLETFWNGWNGYNYQSAYDLTTLLQDRVIEYWPDGYENNDSDITATTYTPAILNAASCASTLCEGMHFTYYPAGDADWIAFNATAGTTYEITTFNILGADTYLKIYKQDGTTFINPNDDIEFCPDFYFEQSCLASSMTFTAATTGTHYIESYTSPFNYYTYGSYNLRILTK